MYISYGDFMPPNYDFIYYSVTSLLTMWLLMTFFPPVIATYLRMQLFLVIPNVYLEVQSPNCDFISLNVALYFKTLYLRLFLILNSLIIFNAEAEMDVQSCVRYMYVTLLIFLSVCRVTGIQLFSITDNKYILRTKLFILWHVCVCVCASRSHLRSGYARGPCSSLPGLQKRWFAETVTEIWGGKKSVSHVWHCLILKICVCK